MFQLNRLQLMVDGSVRDRNLLEEERLSKMIREMQALIGLRGCEQRTQSEASALEGLEKRIFSIGAIGAGASVEIHVWRGSGSFMLSAFAPRFDQSLLLAVLRRHLSPIGLNVRTVVRCPDLVI